MTRKIYRPKGNPTRNREIAEWWMYANYDMMDAAEKVEYEMKIRGVGKFSTKDGAEVVFAIQRLLLGIEP